MESERDLTLGELIERSTDSSGRFNLFIKMPIIYSDSLRHDKEFWQTWKDRITVWVYNSMKSIQDALIRLERMIEELDDTR